jgi:uncharacterized membrane protein (UPF0127 family)
VLPPRLRRLPRVVLDVPLLVDRDVRRAEGPRARLVGLAFLGTLPPDAGLLLERTRSIHTFGMRFALDLVWLDDAGRVVRVDRGVRPGRVRGCRSARAVVELQAGRATDRRDTTYCSRPTD